MKTDQELMQQALEALTNSRSLEPVDVDWVKGKRRAVIAALRERLARQEHDLYTDADANRPEVICDRNGQVVLSLCKRCGKGEAELEGPCAPKRQEDEPVAFDHSVGADRYKVVKGAFWWHIRIGGGTANVGKFHSRLAAEDMALKLLTAYRDGAWTQYNTTHPQPAAPAIPEGMKLVPVAEHIFNGACPESDADMSRDPECPACRAMLSAAPSPKENKE